MIATCVAIYVCVKNKANNTDNVIPHQNPGFLNPPELQNPSPNGDQNQQFELQNPPRRQGRIEQYANQNLINIRLD